MQPTDPRTLLRALLLAALPIGVAGIPSTARACTALAQEDKDTIVLKNGTSQSGKITAEEYSGVKYTNAKKQEVALKWEEIASVQLAGAPELYGAKDAIDAGRFEEAVAPLDKLLGDKKLKPVLRQEALYQYARAQQRLNQHDPAVNAYKELVKTFGNGRYLFAAGNGLTALFLTRNDPVAAGRALDDVAAAATSSNVDLGYLASFGVLRGRILEAQKKPVEAQSAYEKVLNTKDAPADAVSMAKLGVARMLQVGGKRSDAEQRYKELVKQRPPTTVMAGAWNGLGDLAYEDALKKKDLDGLTAALQDYLHGVVLDVPPAGEPTDEYEHALAGSANCLKALGDLEPNADAKKSFLERARQRRDLLKTQFPASRFAESK